MLKIALVGAELKENLGLRYMTSALEREKHRVEIVPFNTEQDISQTVKQVIAFSPQVTSLSMVFTSRARVLSSGLSDPRYVSRRIIVCPRKVNKVVMSWSDA